jgi:hypothetical protein
MSRKDVQVTRKDRQIVVAFLPQWKENILTFVARLLGLKGMPVGLITAKFLDEIEPTINDIRKNQEEDEMNRQREENRG